MVMPPYLTVETQDGGTHEAYMWQLAMIDEQWQSVPMSNELTKMVDETLREAIWQRAHRVWGEEVNLSGYKLCS